MISYSIHFPAAFTQLTFGIVDNSARLFRPNQMFNLFLPIYFSVHGRRIQLCIINQEFTPCPENERVHEQHGLGLPVRSAHDPSGARPLDTVDPGGKLEYYALHIRNFAHYLSRSNRGIEDTDFPRPSEVEVLQFKGFHTSLVATPYDPYCCSC